MILERDLQSLALVARHYPSETLDRRLALTHLCARLQADGKLYVPSVLGMCPQQFEELSREVCGNTWTYICCNIDTYSVEDGSFLDWANGVLLGQFCDALQEEGDRLN